jgi:hypothetical protein
MMLLTVAALVALLAPSGQVPIDLEVLSIAFGKLYRSTVTPAVLAKTPVWDEKDENPPVSARQAIKLADKARERIVKDTDDWKWHREHVELHEFFGRWYWTVRYRAYNTDIVFYVTLPELTLVVLMDGTVIEPTIVEPKKK